MEMIVCTGSVRSRDTTDWVYVISHKDKDLLSKGFGLELDAHVNLLPKYKMFILGKAGIRWSKMVV